MYSAEWPVSLRRGWLLCHNSPPLYSIFSASKLLWAIIFLSFFLIHNLMAFYFFVVGLVALLWVLLCFIAIHAIAYFQHKEYERSISGFAPYGCLVECMHFFVIAVSGILTQWMAIIDMNSYFLSSYHQDHAFFVTFVQLRLQFITIILLFIMRSIVLWIQQVRLHPSFFTGTAPKENGVMLFEVLLQQRSQRIPMWLSVYVPWILINVL